MSLIVSIPAHKLQPSEKIYFDSSMQHTPVIEEFRRQGCLIKMLCGSEQEDTSNPMHRTEQELDELTVQGQVLNSCTSFIKNGTMVEPYKSIGFILSTDTTELLEFWDDWSYTLRFNNDNHRVQWNPHSHCHCTYNPMTQMYDIKSEYSGIYYQRPPMQRPTDICYMSYRSFHSFEQFKDHMEHKNIFDNRNEVVVTYSTSSIVGIIVDKCNWESQKATLAKKIIFFNKMAKEKLNRDLPLFLFDSKCGHLEPFLRAN